MVDGHGARQTFVNPFESFLVYWEKFHPWGKHWRPGNGGTVVALENNEYIFGYLISGELHYLLISLMIPVASLLSAAVRWVYLITQSMR